jgi:hypothetical protein
MMDYLHDWYRDYISHKYEYRDRWSETPAPDLQRPLIDIRPGPCPRLLLALRQRHDRVYGELVAEVNSEIETGRTTQTYYTWFEDLADLLERPFIPWYVFDSRADLLRRELSKHTSDSQYPTYSHEYKITSEAIRLLRACGRTLRAVYILEKQTLQRLQPPRSSAPLRLCV